VACAPTFTIELLENGQRNMEKPAFPADVAPDILNHWSMHPEAGPRELCLSSEALRQVKNGFTETDKAEERLIKARVWELPQA